MSRPGDWNCRSCQHLNFQRRDTCQRCGDPRSAELGGRPMVGGSSYGHGHGYGYGGGADVRPGDWYCDSRGCGTHNFASRTSCFKCGAFKDSDASGGLEGDLSRRRGFPGGSGGGGGGGGGRSGWKSGDWICNRFDCNEHNFANRMECFRCNARRDFSSG